MEQLEFANMIISIVDAKISLLEKIQVANKKIESLDNIMNSTEGYNLMVHRQSEMVSADLEKAIRDVQKTVDAFMRAL